MKIKKPWDTILRGCIIGATIAITGIAVLYASGINIVEAANNQKIERYKIICANEYDFFQHSTNSTREGNMSACIQREIHHERHMRLLILLNKIETAPSAEKEHVLRQELENFLSKPKL